MFYAALSHPSVSFPNSKKPKTSVDHNFSLQIGLVVARSLTISISQWKGMEPKKLHSISCSTYVFNVHDCAQTTNYSTTIKKRSGVNLSVLATVSNETEEKREIVPKEK